jgi:NAD(P)-dependent dehydrogenase (short-subunit alcohol dehydrogenase family)
MPSISGHSILVISGSSGIGFAVTNLALEQGALVSIASSSPTRVFNAVERLKLVHPSLEEPYIRGFTIDLSTPNVETDLETLLTTVSATAKLNHVILTAGRASMRPLTAIDQPYIQNELLLPLTVPSLLAKLAPRYLEPSYKSSLTFCGGRLGTKPSRGWPMGAACSAGLDGLTRALALDLAPIRVNVVHPGATETELWGSLGGADRQKTREYFEKTSLLGRVAGPEDVAEAFVYLLRDCYGGECAF